MGALQHDVGLGLVFPLPGRLPLFATRAGFDVRAKAPSLKTRPQFSRDMGAGFGGPETGGHAGVDGPGRQPQEETTVMPTPMNQRDEDRTSTERTEAIAKANDAFRRLGGVCPAHVGRWVYTRGVDAKGAKFIASAIEAVATYDALPRSMASRRRPSPSRSASPPPRPRLAPGP